jgi:hypothetical protein
MTRRDLELLQSQQEYPSVSITVALAKAMPDRKNNEIKVRDALKDVKHRLLQEFSEEEINPILAKLQSEVEALDFSNIHGHGLAFFANKNVAARYELPFAVADRIVVDSIFEIREIFKALQRLPQYWVLALSEKPSRLFRGTHDALHEIIEPAQDEFGNDKDGFPYNYVAPDVRNPHEMMGDHLMRDARHFDECKEKFFERVFKLADRFFKAEHLPLIVIADEKNYSLFKKVSHDYPVAEHVHGDYCKRSAYEIAQVVWPAIEKYLADEIAKKIVDFSEKAMGSKKHAVGFADVWAAAQDGRVHELLLEEDFSIAGTPDPLDKFKYLLLEGPKSASNPDIINDLIEIVLSKGDATVTFCKPGSLEKYGHVAAILRY